ncbi:MAG TPA: ABC transporter permease [Terrimesophilobacter sp.]|uniref:ABC transporter permease n=1 Tax=Terrimesophilobacter sp. TaxID=2906435 RepID=UPI002F94A13A
MNDRSRVEPVETMNAMTGGTKPRRYGSWYVAEHRVRAMRAYLQTVIFTSFGNPLVYLFALGVGLASLVPTGVGQVSYLVFVAPALLATAAVTVAAEESTYPMMMGFKWNPIFFAMNAAPISGNQIANGMFIGMLARIVPTCTIYFIVMLFFGAVPWPIGFLSILTATLTGLAIGTVIASYTSRIEEDKGQMAMIMRFGITPMFLFSGTFFPLTQLPVYLQWIGWVSPLWHGAELGRVLSYGYPEPIWLTAGHVGYLVILALIGWKVTQGVVSRRLNK